MVNLNPYVVSTQKVNKQKVHTKRLRKLAPLKWEPVSLESKKEHMHLSNFKKFTQKGKF